MTSFVRVPAVERSLTRGRLLVLPLGNDTPTELDGSAPDVWSALADATDFVELTRILQARYDDDEAVISNGLSEALDQLVNAGLVEAQE
jgi:hypothetical protein